MLTASRYGVRVERRAFLVGGMAGTVFVACRSWVRPDARPEVVGAHELATIAAMADTFLPGGDGTPGARDVDAVRVIVDPANGINPYVSEVVSDLDDWCRSAHGGRRFVDLADDERERALEERMGLVTPAIRSLYLPAYEGVLALAKLALFGGVANHLGTGWIGFPGASRGYAPGAAAGAYAATDTPLALADGATSRVEVAGAGRVAHVALSALATSDDDARASLRVTAPDGTATRVPLALADGTAVVDDLALPLAGGPAAGAWTIAVELRGGRGRLELWSLRLRTDLDDAIGGAA